VDEIVDQIIELIFGKVGLRNIIQLGVLYDN